MLGRAFRYVLDPVEVPPRRRIAYRGGIVMTRDRTHQQLFKVGLRGRRLRSALFLCEERGLRGGEFFRPGSGASVREKTFAGNHRGVGFEQSHVTSSCRRVPF